MTIARNGGQVGATRPILRSVSTHRAAAPRRSPNSPFKDRPVAEVETFEEGDRVSHDTHGLGSIVSLVNGNSVLVAFGENRQMIATPYPKLHKL